MSKVQVGGGGICALLNALLAVHIVYQILKIIGLKLWENHGMSYKSYILA